MKIYKILFIIFLCINIFNIFGCSDNKTPQVVHEHKLIKQDPTEIDKYVDGVKTKIIVKGKPGIYFEGYYISGSNFKGEKQDSAFISGVTPKEFEINNGTAMYCSVAKTRPGKISVSIWDDRNDIIVSDSSEADEATVYIGSIKLNGTRMLISQINKDPQYFLEVESKENVTYTAMIHKIWDNGLNTGSSIIKKTPFTLELPKCDNLRVFFLKPKGVKKFFVNLYDESRKLLERDSCTADMNSFVFSYPLDERYRKLSYLK